MKIKHVATAAALPAAIAGAAISFGVTGHAAASPPAPARSHQQAKPSSARVTSDQTGAAKAAPAHAAARSVWVTVKPGQTLSGIASAHHMTWEAIYATPPNMKVLHDPNLLTAGERLRIPLDAKLRAAQFEKKYAASLKQDTASAPAAAAAPASATTGGSYSGAGESAFEQCVAYRESSDTPTDPDGLFGMLPSTWQSLGYSGSAGQYSVAVQEQAFAKLYAEEGTAPWAAYDGC
jgi:LysM repeat protein